MQHEPGRLLHHTTATLKLAAPIAAAQLAQMAMGLTDTIMLGRVGDTALAAGGLGATLYFTCLFTFQGVLSGTAVLASRARGAGATADVPAIYWSGLLLAALLTIPMFALMSHPGPLLRAAGDSQVLMQNVQDYLSVLRWSVPAGVMGIGLVRGFLPAIELQRLMLYVIPFAVVLNAILNVWFIYGGLGLAAYGMRGSAAATAVSLWVSAIGLLGLLHMHHQAHWVRPAWPRPRLILDLLTIGLPVGMTMVVEAALFLVTALLIGGLGRVALAAHTVAISVASVTFMVPLAISQAANVRVGYEAGAGRPEAARRAGFVAIALSATFMSGAALVMLTAPAVVVGLYVAAGSPSYGLAIRLLRVAGAFQIADGVQVTASGALRGLKDTRIPMLLAAFGYWGIGFWLGRALAFSMGLGVVGLWWGLFAGLATAAVCLTGRFAVFSQPRVAIA
jgi:MATE family multidrug resistance protein